MKNVNVSDARDSQNHGTWRPIIFAYTMEIQRRENMHTYSLNRQVHFCTDQKQFNFQEAAYT